MAEHCPNCGEKLRPDALLTWGGWHLDEYGQELSFANERIRLTPAHRDVMAALIRFRGRVVSKEALFGAVYSTRPECDHPEIKIVDVFVCKLKKMHPLIYSGVDTIWGRGYRLLPLPEPHVSPPESEIPLTETPSHVVTSRESI